MRGLPLVLFQVPRTIIVITCDSAVFRVSSPYRVHIPTESPFGNNYNWFHYRSILNLLTPYNSMVFQTISHGSKEASSRGLISFVFCISPDMTQHYVPL